MTIELKPTHDHQAGHAELSISPWTDGIDGIELCIQRNQGAPFMTTAGNWSQSQQWLEISGAWRDDDALRLAVGPQVVDTLLLSDFKTFRGLVRVNGGQQTPHAITVSPTLLPSSAKGNAPSVVGQGAIVGTPATPKPIAPDAASPSTLDVPVAAPSPQPAPEPTSSAETNTKPAAGRRSLKLGIAVLLLLLLAAAAYFAWKHFAAETDPPVTVVHTAPASTASPAGCTADNMAKPDELAFVQQCIRDVQDSAALLAIITSAKNSLNCGVAQRLYANRAQGGNNAIALAYAKEYDPKFYQPNKCFAKADAATAAYWYEVVLSRDANNAEARTRLQDMKK